MIKLELNPQKFNEIIKKGYDLNIIFLLKMIEGGYIFEECIGGDVSSLKIVNLEQSILRKGLVTDTNQLTTEGKELLDFLTKTENNIKLVKKKPKDENFTLWWNAYPSTDEFTYKGRTFVGTRSLKAKKEDCKEKLHKILSEGVYTIEELVKALEYEVQQKKENSIKTGKNSLSYMQNSSTYLNQFTYESYIELVRSGSKVKETKQDYDGVNI